MLVEVSAPIKYSNGQIDILKFTAEVYNPPKKDGEINEIIWMDKPQIKVIEETS